jgi:hypothetical protein
MKMLLRLAVACLLSLSTSGQLTRSAAVGGGAALGSAPRSNFPPQLPRPFTLPETMLQRSAHNLWRSPRLARLAERLTTPGGNLTLAVLGGSFSAPMKDNWVAQAGHALRAWFPDLTVRVVNAAKGGSTPSYALACTEFLVPPEEADVVVVEYNPNTLFSCHARTPAEAPKCVEFEILLRKLQSWRRRPLLLLLQMSYPMPESYPNGPSTAFQYTAEEAMGTLAAYYGLPYVSLRDALWQSARAGVPGFTDADTRNLEGPPGKQSLFHYKAAGHTLAADALLYWLREGLALAARGGGGGGGGDGGDALSSDEHLPPPLWRAAAEVPATLICGHSTFNESGSSALRVAAAPGWRLLADDPRRKKFGYVQHGRNTASALAFSWKPPRDVPGGATVVLLGYLKSYDSVMGAFDARCAGGCTCAPARVDCLDTRSRTSTTEFVRLPLNVSATGGACSLRVTPAADNADAAKVKISALVVLSCDAQPCEALDYVSPQRVDY